MSKSRTHNDASGWQNPEHMRGAYGCQNPEHIMSLRMKKFRKDKGVCGWHYHAYEYINAEANYSYFF